MTRISMTLASAALTLSLAPAAQAYAPEPAEGPQTPATLALLQADGQCALNLTQALIAALNLPVQDRVAPKPAAVACNS